MGVTNHVPSGRDPHYPSCPHADVCPHCGAPKARPAYPYVQPYPYRYPHTDPYVWPNSSQTAPMPKHYPMWVM